MSCFKLMCPNCGSENFMVEMDAKDTSSYEVACADCRVSVATVDSYGVEWVKEDEDKDASSSD